MHKFVILFVVLGLLTPQPLPGYTIAGGVYAKRAGACCPNCPVSREANGEQSVCAEACGCSLPTPILPAVTQAFNPETGSVIMVLAPRLAALRPFFARRGALPLLRPAIQLDSLCSRQL